MGHAECALCCAAGLTGVGMLRCWHDGAGCRALGRVDRALCCAAGMTGVGMLRCWHDGAVRQCVVVLWVWSARWT